MRRLWPYSCSGGYRLWKTRVLLRASTAHSRRPTSPILPAYVSSGSVLCENFRSTFPSPYIRIAKVAQGLTHYHRHHSSYLYNCVCRHSFSAVQANRGELESYYQRDGGLSPSKLISSCIILYYRFVEHLKSLIDFIQRLTRSMIAAISIFTDFLCTTLPFPIVKDLNMSRKTKTSVLVLLWLGSM